MGKQGGYDGLVGSSIEGRNNQRPAKERCFSWKIIMLPVAETKLLKCVISYCFSYLFGVSHGNRQNLNAFRALGPLAT